MSPEGAGLIVTFYSFKGGVGRSMAVANIATVLAKRGKRVLCVDFDLEAPGLDRYFAWRPNAHAQGGQGVVELLHEAAKGAEPDYRAYVTRVDVGGTELHLMTAGRRDEGYAARVLAFDWEAFFERGGGDFLETLREQWRANYDFVFIDSRTGVTDSGGVCTIQLPDVLVPVFTTNEQSLEGVRDITVRAQRARRELAYERARLLIFPLLSRYDGRAELERAQQWLDAFGRRLGPLMEDWMPRTHEPREVFERIKIPYVAYFSFGENLPVLTHGTADPESIGYAFDVASRVLETRFASVGDVLGTSVRQPLPALAKEEPKKEAPSASVPASKVPFRVAAVLATSFGMACVAALVALGVTSGEYGSCIDDKTTAGNLLTDCTQGKADAENARKTAEARLATAEGPTGHLASCRKTLEEVKNVASGSGSDLQQCRSALVRLRLSSDAERERRQDCEEKQKSCDQKQVGADKALSDCTNANKKCSSDLALCRKSKLPSPLPHF